MTSHPRSQPEGGQETAVKDRLANIMTWLREPDWIEEASLAWVGDWMNRRPIAELAMVAMLMPNETPHPNIGVQSEPVAWKHTMWMEAGQIQSRLTHTASHPFGLPGKHYSEEYRITSTPLYAATSLSSADQCCPISGKPCDCIVPCSLSSTNLGGDK